MIRYRFQESHSIRKTEGFIIGGAVPPLPVQTGPCRFYQYDKTYSDDCMHGRTTNCTFDGTPLLNPRSRTWGHTVSRDGATWEDWPGVDADSVADAPGVFSGNCVINDDSHPVCIYSNGCPTPAALEALSPLPGACRPV